MACRTKSDYVLAYKIAGTVFEKIVDAVFDAGGSDEHLHRLETDEARLAEVAAVIIGTLDVVPVTPDMSAGSVGNPIPWDDGGRNPA